MEGQKMTLRLHKADSVCRLCRHLFSHHCLYVELRQGYAIQSLVQPIDMVPCNAYARVNGGMDMTERCGCLDWQPMDNLEYLELKAEQTATPTEDTW
jgi:hypothetical protein